MFESYHLFLYLGLGLIVLALFSSLITTEISYIDSGFTRYANAPTGLIIFAPIIGSYGLTSIVLGIVELPMSKKENLLFFLPIFGLIYIRTSLVVWSAIRNIIADPQWFHLSMLLAPGIAVSEVGFLNFAKKEFLSRVLRHLAIRIAIFSILIAFPLIYLAVLWLFFS